MRRLVAVLMTTVAVTATVASVGGGAEAMEPTGNASRSCTKPGGVQSLVWPVAKYPRIRAHALAAIRKGWPSVLVLNRKGASSRRNRLLAGIPTKRGYDRDEYPPAVGRGVGVHLQSGSGPRGWKADVRYVPSRENRSHGSSMGAKLRKFCDGTKFRYVFR